ncbi:hypothetical protein [Bacillus luti]|uniref:hypothetical protein n=1 Tax=Bacillus luti TaxID=2026191 RepID=UPI0013F4EB14|nr:hypothetical protein [Bacillus luti]
MKTLKRRYKFQFAILIEVLLVTPVMSLRNQNFLTEEGWSTVFKDTILETVKKWRRF